ncbi:hypothetical protein BHE74_00048358 [Ensete ventricosum]|nr:hypothetical protein BHE74_00048358 [Ensete ventricosum]
MCGLCQHLVGPLPSPIFGSLPWQFTFVYPLLGHTWTKHSFRTVRRLVAHEVPLTSLELVYHYLDPGPLSPTSIISAIHHFRLRTYPFYVEEKVLMLHGAEFRSRLGMATNTPSFVYKPLHEYRILRVSNSPHLCELCTTLSVVTQHLPLCTVSSLTKHPACLEHHQV